MTPRRRSLPLLALSRFLTAPAAAQQPPPLVQLAPYLRLNGELRGRVEYNDFCRPSPARHNDNESVFGATRARLGLALTTPLVEGLVQAEQ